MKYRLFPAILSLAGWGIILVVTSQYGAGISQDSVGYTATARHIADGMERRVKVRASGYREVKMAVALFTHWSENICKCGVSVLASQRCEESAPRRGRRLVFFSAPAQSAQHHA